jgi:hypothetical protein
MQWFIKHFVRVDK